ncbi:MAG TPA: penicillin-binding protein 1A [Allocoleopsis sp.]
MSKFIPKHKNLSSQSNSAASAQPDANLDSQSGVQQDEKDQHSSQPLLLARCRQGAMLTLHGLMRFPGAVVEQFTGPRQLHRRYWFWLGLGAGGGAIALGFGAVALEQSLPTSTREVLTYVRNDTLTIKAADGTILQQVGPATRESLSKKEIPQRLVQAFLATEDRRFEKHHGVDFQGVVRAALSNLQAGGVVEGGSTITQQLARIVYFDQERSIGRKLREMRMAQKIEHDLTKDQILERYLNLVYLGSGAYGVADAASVYLSKTVNQLTLPEMAMIAGLPSAPNDYSPFVNPKAAKERRDTVLRRMQESGFITKAEADEAIATPLTTKRSNPKRLERKASYFTEYIQQELPKYVSKDELAHKGLTIETTLNTDWQDAAEKAVKEAVDENGRWEGFKQAAMVAIDPRNGQIKAMVGGKDFFDQQFNRVTQAQRQPGSTFKTFLYTAAVAAGISPNQGYLDAPFTVDGYTPKNYHEKFRGWISIKDALTYSINIVAVKTLIDVGWNPVIQVAKKMGIESPLQPTYSLALGASEVNLLELTSAYGSLATQGIHVKPHGIHRILDQHGKVIYEEKFKGERALDEDTSSIMTWMLRGVVNDGTGRSAQLDDRPVAGKTGTSDEARDLWFIGYIPQLVAGVWLGNDDNTPTSGASSTAAYTWHQFMVKAVKNMDVEKFPDRPEKIEGRKPVIKAEPIRPKRTIERAIDNSDDSSSNSDSNDSDSSSRRRYRSDNSDSSDSDNTSARSSRRRYRSSYSSNSDSTGSDDSSSQPRRSRRRQRSSSESDSQSQASSNNDSQQEQPVRRKRSRRRVYVDNSTSSSSTSSSSSRSDSSGDSTPRRSSRRQRTDDSASESSNSSAGSSSRSEQKFVPAPVAAPPAPPASRKESSSAPTSSEASASSSGQ